MAEFVTGRVDPWPHYNWVSGVMINGLVVIITYQGNAWYNWIISGISSDNTPNNQTNLHTTDCLYRCLYNTGKQIDGEAGDVSRQ